LAKFNLEFNPALANSKGSRICHDVLLGRHLAKVSTPPRLFRLLPKHSSGLQFETEAKLLEFVLAFYFAVAQ
jgi:hypothetical protein